MNRDLFRKFNFIIYLAFIFALISLETTLFRYGALHYFQPDLFLILCIYIGFKRDIVEGALLVTLGALFLEAHSSAGNFYFFTLYLYVFVASKILSRAVVVPDLISSVGMTVSLSILKKIGILVLLGLQAKAMNGVKHFFIFLIPGLLSQVFFTPVLFSLFLKIDLATYKDEHAEDEYGFNKGF